MIKKIFLAFLSALLGLFGAVFAQSGAVISEVPALALKATNLPVAFSGEFTLELALEQQQFAQSGQELELSFSQCGSGKAELFYHNEQKTDLISRFTLWDAEKINFPLLIKKADPESCQLNFLVKDKLSLSKLAETSIVLNPSCHPAIDHDMDTLLSGVVSTAADQTFLSSETARTNDWSQEDKKLNAELQSAFDWAVSKGFVEDSELAKARFQAPMTRIAFAQMLLAVSEKLWLEEQADKSCDFADLKGAPEATITTAKAVCQLNIMGIHPDQSALENFMPDQLVDRAQMITVLSRMLWGATFNQGGNTFYQKHLEKAVNEQLITHKNASALELQGYFYLVLQRAENKKLLTRKD